MKKKLLFLPFLAALAFAGCSNDDLSTDGGEKPGTGDLRYLAVNIVTPNESAKKPMLRGANGSFEAGTDDENAVTKALFILLNGNSVVKTATVTDLAPWSNGAANGSVEKISSAVLVIDGETEKPTVDGILAVLNPPAGLSFAAGTTLDQVKAKIDNYGAATKGNFVMSNSVYVDGSAAHIAETVTEANLGRTEDAAKNNPVNIYVERVVAKITTNAVADITPEGSFNKGASVTMNGASAATDVKIDIRGIQIANSAKKSYLFKNISGFAASAPFTDWSDADNHRSYWAVVPELNDFENNSWNEISGEDAAGNTARPLTEAQTFYAQENICDGGIGAGPGHTAVIVTAQLQKQNAQGNYEAFELVKLANEYYTSEDALEQLAGYLNSRGYRVKTTETAADGSTTTTYATLEVNCLEWLAEAPVSDAKGWEGFAQLKTAYAEGKTFAKYNAASTAADKFDEVSAAAINTELQGEDFRALKWTNGCCYYFVDIEHFGTKTAEGAADPVKLKGIIRNHIYSLNLQSLSGLGIPVFDPTVDIIPERPGEEQLFYLAARINILPWVLVNQDVNFN